MQFSPDGKTVVTASFSFFPSTSKDTTVRLWDAASGRELQVLRGHDDSVNSVQFSPDGKIVVTASDDNTARFWLCSVCRPVDEIAAELTKAVGRGLTEEEQRRFSLNETEPFSLSSLFSR